VLAGADEAELDAVPSDGGWTARMVIHHRADSKSNSYLWVRKLLAEDEPHPMPGNDRLRQAQSRV
jgi:DinB superfamily